MSDYNWKGDQHTSAGRAALGDFCCCPQQSTVSLPALNATWEEPDGKCSEDVDDDVVDDEILSIWG